MRKKMKALLTNAGYEIEHRLKLLCGNPTPMKRFIIVLVIGGVLSVVSIHTLVTSIYNIGKQDAEKEFMEWQHIETLKLQQKRDSINILIKKDYEYEQSDR